MKKKLTALMFTLVSLFSMAMSAMATTTVDVSDLMEEGVKTVQADIMAVIAAVLPILIAVTAIIIAIKFGLKFIRKLGSQG